MIGWDLLLELAPDVRMISGIVLLISQLAITNLTPNFSNPGPQLWPQGFNEDYS